MITDAKQLLDELEPYPLMKRCFTPYVSWFVKNVANDCESYDVIDALSKKKTDRLRACEDLLSKARGILNISEPQFAKSFGFTDDMRTKDPEKIHDLLAEILVVVDLHDRGFSQIQKLHSSNIPISDFIATLSDCKFAIEVKTIRMEAEPKPSLGKLIGDGIKPSWWSEMFYNNAIKKITSENKKVLRQLENTASKYHCHKRMLVLYTRRLGTSALMTPCEYHTELEKIFEKFTQLDYVVAKNYFGEIFFFPKFDVPDVGR